MAEAIPFLCSITSEWTDMQFSMEPIQHYINVIMFCVVWYHPLPRLQSVVLVGSNTFQGSFFPGIVLSYLGTPFTHTIIMLPSLIGMVHYH